MTIRTRLTLWYSGVLLVSAAAIAVLSVQELYEKHDLAENPREGLEDVVGFVCWLGIPAILLSIGGGWWLMRRALAPLATLTEAARNINERNLDEKLPSSKNGDELDRLTEVFNGMTSRLHDSFSRIREFTLHASHELKTPLTVLCGETETELQDPTLAPAQHERAASRLEELRRLARIVDGLTLLAKADAGLVKLEQVPLAFDEVVRDCFDDAQLLARESGVSVELTSCEAVIVKGDAHRLRQLLLNLADNAVKYNQPGGTIAMALRQSDGRAEFSISNTGPGISAEALPRVFDRFFRGDPSHQSEIEGSGLGLSIAQWIVSVHKGTIKMESMPGKTTTVTVRLPLAEREVS